MSIVPWVSVSVARVREGPCISLGEELLLLEVGWVQYMSLRRAQFLPRCQLSKGERGRHTTPSRDPPLDQRYRTHSSIFQL